MIGIPKLIGIDLGTHSLRVNVFTQHGTILDSAQSSYSLYKPQPLWVEQDPIDWWRALCNSITTIIKRGKINLSSIDAIGIAGQTNGHVLLDNNGEVIGRSIIWMDRRASEEAEWLQKIFSEAERIQYFGVNLPLDSTTIPARLLWLYKHKPDIMQNVKVVLQPKDFINYKLTGNLATDVISCKTIINLFTGQFDSEYFSKAMLNKDIFPKVYQPTHIIGTTKCNATTGIPDGIPVVAGTIDAWTTILGSGVVNPGQAAEISGSSEVLSVVSTNIVYTNRFNVIPSFDKVIFNGPTQSGGGSLDWFAEIVLGKVTEESNKKKLLFKKWFSNIENVPAGSHGLLFIPYLEGERTPIWDSNARGSFLGLNSSQDQLCLVRSILEGVAFNMRHVLNTIETVGGVTVSTICISGGGSTNENWNQIKADILGKELLRPKVLDTTSLGAAMLAGIGVGVYKDYEHSAKEAVSYTESYLPDENNREIYEKGFAIYKEYYPRFKDLFSLMEY